MTTDQRTTVVDSIKSVISERLALRRWFRLNACARHGIPLDDAVPLEVTVNHVGGTATPVQQPATPATATAITEKPATMPAWLKTALAVTGMSAAGVGGGALYDWWKGGDESSTTIIEQPADRSGSLLQDLEDRGFHLEQPN